MKIRIRGSGCTSGTGRLLRGRWRVGRRKRRTGGDLTLDEIEDSGGRLEAHVQVLEGLVSARGIF